MSSFLNKRCVIRGDRSGVFFGEVVSHEKGLTELKNVRRLWYWDGAASISQIALNGVREPQKCKFTVTVDTIVLTDVIEIIPATEGACASIDAVAVWAR